MFYSYLKATIILSRKAALVNLGRGVDSAPLAENYYFCSNQRRGVDFPVRKNIIASARPHFDTR